MDEKQLQQPENPNDKLGTGLQILSFCIPIAGAIIYFSNKDEYPNKSKQACHAALWGVGIGIVINIIVKMIEMSAR